MLLEPAAVSICRPLLAQCYQWRCRQSLTKATSSASKQSESQAVAWWRTGYVPAVVTAFNDSWTSCLVSSSGPWPDLSYRYFAKFCIINWLLNSSAIFEHQQLQYLQYCWTQLDQYLDHPNSLEECHPHPARQASDCEIDCKTSTCQLTQSCHRRPAGIADCHLHGVTASLGCSRQAAAAKMHMPETVPLGPPTFDCCSYLNRYLINIMKAEAFLPKINRNRMIL